MAAVRLDYNIVFFPLGVRGLFPQGTNVLEAARKIGADISSLCGGKGTCGKCKIIVEKGAELLEPYTEAEEKFLTSEEMDARYRLACAISISEGVRLAIRVPERSRVGKQRLQTEGLEVPVSPNPLIRKYLVKMHKGTLKDPRADEERLIDSLKEQQGIDDVIVPFEVVQRLPFAIREGKWEVTIVLHGNEIIGVEPGDTTGKCFGFACDIGSTKLAGFLMDLNTGKVAAIASKMNPQIPFGEDIFSRITYAIKAKTQENLQTLQKVVVEGINEMIMECCEKAGVKPEEIYEVVLVGNTAMHHLFFGLWPKFVAYSPYSPVRKKGLEYKAARIGPGLKMNWNAYAYYLPLIGGFIGADQVGCQLGLHMLDSEELIMELDIGTNTEIALGNRERGIMTVSCASGPAFEGMHIKHGMRAATAAIEKISIDPYTLELTYRTIEDAKPVGICGSGLIDVPAEFLKAGILDMSGRFNPELEKVDKRLRMNPQGIYEFVLIPKEETATGEDIVVTQDDIRELQKSKAAMRTGCEILMRRMGVKEDDVDKLVIAGAFGQYIDPESARTVGLYPELQLEKVQIIGNAAGTGARIALINKEEREYAELLSSKVKYHELAIDPDFVRVYADSMYIPYRDLSRCPITEKLLRRLGRIS